MIVTYQWIQFICKFFLEWMPVFPCAPGNCREWYIYIYIIVFNLVPWFLDEVGYWQILKYNSHFKRKLVANFKLIYQKQKAFHFDFYIVSQVVLVLRSSMQLVLWLQPLSGELSTGILAFMVYCTCMLPRSSVIRIELSWDENQGLQRTTRLSGILMTTHKLSSFFVYLICLPRKQVMMIHRHPVYPAALLGISFSYCLLSVRSISLCISSIISS